MYDLTVGIHGYASEYNAVTSAKPDPQNPEHYLRR
jgi:hypothetical protein